MHLAPTTGGIGHAQDSSHPCVRACVCVCVCVCLAHPVPFLVPYAKVQARAIFVRPQLRIVFYCITVNEAHTYSMRTNVDPLFRG